MDGFLGGTFPVEHDALSQLGRIRIFAGILDRCSRGYRRCHYSGCSGFKFGFEHAERAFVPFCKIIVVVYIAIHAVVDALRAEAFEAGVEVDPHFAKLLVTGVAETEHRKASIAQFGCLVAHEGFIKVDRGFGWVALAPSADDYEKVLNVFQLGHFYVGHIDRLRYEAFALRCFHSEVGETLGVA